MVRITSRLRSMWIGAKTIMPFNHTKLGINMILFMLLFSQGQSFVFGQSNQLRVGDPAPAIRALKWIKGQPISSFDKNHIYIIEFGATWCAPCRAAIPKLTQLAQTNPKEVTVVSFFVMEPNTSPPDAIPSYVDRVDRYVQQKGDKIQYRVALDDAKGYMNNTWLKAAGLSGIPQVFIISGGKIIWIGNNMNTLETKVEQLLATGQVKVQLQKQIPASKPDDSVFFSSTLSRFQTTDPPLVYLDFISSYWWAAQDPKYADQLGRVRIRGASLRKLYYLAYGDTLYNFPPDRGLGSNHFPDTIKFPSQRRAYGKYWYRPILELDDTTFFVSTVKSPHNRFNYELKVPRKIGTASFLQEAMRADLKRYFGYEVTVEERLMPCWNIIFTEEGKQKLPSKTPGDYRYDIDSHGNHHFINAEIRDIIFQLEINYGLCQVLQLIHHPSNQPPFFDATGYKGTINYTVPAADANAFINAANEGREFSFEDYRSILKRCGLELIPAHRKMKVVVIREPEE